MFSHILLGTNDLVASRRFYDAVMPSLGYACHDSGASYAGYGLKRTLAAAKTVYGWGFHETETPQVLATEPT